MSTTNPLPASRQCGTCAWRTNHSTGSNSLTSSCSGPSRLRTPGLPSCRHWCSLLGPSPPRRWHGTHYLRSHGGSSRSRHSRLKGISLGSRRRCRGPHGSWFLDAGETRSPCWSSPTEHQFEWCPHRRWQVGSARVRSQRLLCTPMCHFRRGPSSASSHHGWGTFSPRGLRSCHWTRDRPFLGLLPRYGPRSPAPVHTHRRTPNSRLWYRSTATGGCSYRRQL